MKKTLRLEIIALIALALCIVAACAPTPTATPVPASTLVPTVPLATPVPGTKAPPVTVVPTPNADVSFKRDVLPIFLGICVRCHGGAKPQNDLTLETYAGALKGGQSGKAVVPRDPDSSIMVRYIQIDFMPFEVEPKLTKDQKQKIVNWIAAGAPDN